MGGNETKAVLCGDEFGAWKRAVKQNALLSKMSRRAVVKCNVIAGDISVIIISIRYRVNEILRALLVDVGVTLVDFKLEFGKMPDGTLVLADEISPDTCRFWDSKTGEKLDKDRFRRDLGGVEDAYLEMQRRILES